MFPGRSLQGKGTRVNRTKKGAVLLGHFLGYNRLFVCGSRGNYVRMPGNSHINAPVFSCIDARSRTVGNVKEKSRARNMCHRFAMG